MRLALDLESELPEAERLNFSIYISPQPPQYILLNGNQTLQQISEKFWKVRNFITVFNKRELVKMRILS